MNGSTVKGALILMVILALAGGAFAADDPDGVRVPLKIVAADPDGGALTFLWEQTEGKPVKIADPRAAKQDKASGKWVSETYFVPTEPDTYKFTVTVRNENGLETKRSLVQPVLAGTPVPDANPGKDTKGRVGSKIVLSGQDSKAYGDRHVEKYEWKVKQAPEDFKLTVEQSAARQFTFVPKTPGKYIFDLRVNDGHRWGEPVSVEVAVSAAAEIQPEPMEPTPGVVIDPPPSIKPPSSLRPKAVASVGDNDGKPFKVGDKIILDGSKSIASESDMPGFSWKQIDTTTDTFVRAYTPDLTQPFSTKRSDKLNFPVQSFVATTNGVYKFVLQMEIGTGTFESDPVTVKVGSGNDRVDPPPVDVNAPRGHAPVVRLTASKTEAVVGDEIMLDGSKSFSDDGTKLTFIWQPALGKKFPLIRGIDGPVQRFSADQPGEYAVQLVVSDGKLQSKSDPVLMTFVAGAKAPTIDLEPAQKCTLGEEIILEAVVKDPQNLPTTVRWSCIEPPLKIPDNLSDKPRFRFHPNKAGTYVFQIEATNEKGLNAVAQTQVGVKGVDKGKPTAVIAGPERANQGATITLSGAGSSSPNGKIQSYRWADISEGGALIKDPVPATRKAEWTFKAADPGRYIVSLVVSDDKYDSEPVKYIVDVAAAPAPVKSKPIARISGPKSVNAKTEVELSGEGSSGDGQLLYYWNQQVDGGPDLALTREQRSGRVLRFTPMKAGTYALTLDVVDQNNQHSETATYTLEVKGVPAAPPIAGTALLTHEPIAVGKEVRLSAEKSVDPAGNPLTYKWKQTKGPQQLVIAPSDNKQEIVVTPVKPGAYELQVVVNNGELESAPSSVSFNATGGALPKAKISEIAPPSVGDVVELDGSESSSPNGMNGELLKYAWRQIKGEPLRLPVGDEKKSKIKFMVPAEGEYAWELVVDDGNDRSEPVLCEFKARPKQNNIPPVAVVERQVMSTEVGMQTVIDASASNDPDKGPQPLSFRWTKNGREVGGTGPILKITPPNTGTMVFEVQAYDGKDYSPPVQITVNVLPQGALPVAVPTVSQPVVKVADREKDKNNPQKVVILDGSNSTPKDKLTYQWKQIDGDNLKLRPEALAKDKVGIRVYKTGTYKFELTVSDGENTSLPATVELKVIDDDGQP